MKSIEDATRKRSYLTRAYNAISGLAVVALLSGCLPGNVQVETSYGTIAGMQDKDLSRFKGIPYAAPPTGDLRWADPQPPAKWDGVYQATQFKPACVQITKIAIAFGSQEDCLTLNIWTPNTPGPHPVMVWVHGGGNGSGGSNELQYDGSLLAKSQNVVVVSLNYRLHVTGFFALPSINGSPAINGNQAIKDQIAALQWVHSEIEKFGGDANNVTVFGESAGAINTCALLASPKTQKPVRLLHKAIMQSGACDTMSVLDLATSQQRGLDIINQLGCGNAQDPLACARSKPLRELKALFTLKDSIIPLPQPGEPEPSPASLVVDGDVLPENPLQLIANTNLSDTPLMIGTNKDEGSMFVGFYNHPADEAGYANMLSEYFPGHENAVAALYPLTDFTNSGQAHSQMTTDFMMNCKALRVARTWSKSNDVFFYHFTHEPTHPLASVLSKLFGKNAPVVGAFHSAEIAYLFRRKMPSEQSEPTEASVVEFVQQAWGNFARSGNPNGDTLPVWEKFDGTRENYMDINAASQNRDGFRAGYCDFWLAY